MDFGIGVGKRILVIDFDDIFLRDFKRVIETEDYHFECALDLEEGMAKLRKGHYDMVIIEPIDIKRGKLERMSVTQPKLWQEAMEHLRRTKTPCMFFSAYDEEEMPGEYALARERGYITRLKPEHTLTLLRDIAEKTLAA
ncbi:response regulator [Candidatus Pacearchaeota archaeon]|nr:response regulator [Candidatus Pacearchaeota archaeon]